MSSMSDMSLFVNKIRKKVILSLAKKYLPSGIYVHIVGRFFFSPKILDEVKLAQGKSIIEKDVIKNE